MENFEKRTIKVGRGFTYSYLFKPSIASGSEHPPLLFQHGFPDSHAVWLNLATRLAALPNALIMPDLLGYGETDKPKDVYALAYDGYTQDMIDIMDAEGVAKVISVGHDHGSIPAQRLYNLHPDRVAALILFNVPYNPPNKDGPLFNIDVLNQWAVETFGYPIFEYWNFFCHDPEASRIMNENIDRVYEAIHTKNMKAMFCTKGAWRQYLEDHSQPPEALKEYALDPQLRDDWLRGVHADGFETPLNYYKAAVQGVHRDSDRKVRDEDMVIRVPVLFIGGKHDPVCRYELGTGGANAGLLPDITTVVSDAGHWPFLERTEEVRESIVRFLEAKNL